ncbi:MAG: ribonuclease HII [Candidatus Aenigmarchaeota archaeon]|nr:ribonuclease HII [Candidatus Aenigmarchaeota archaeon]
MVIAGVTVPKSNEKKLKNFGVNDSKLLSPKKREELYGKIEELSTNIVIMRVQPCKIDNYRAMGINLDKIEAMRMAQIIDLNLNSKIYVDSLSQNSKKFRQLIVSFLQNKEADLVVENYMDETITVVGAASIIAKVERDKAIKELAQQVGQPVGVGYSHDPVTIKFVENLIKQTKGKLPEYVRKSWVTTEMLLEKSWQKKLKDFFFHNKEDCNEGNA